MTIWDMEKSMGAIGIVRKAPSGKDFVSFECRFCGQWYQDNELNPDGTVGEIIDEGRRNHECRYA